MKKTLKLFILLILICLIGFLVYKFIIAKENEPIKQDFSQLEKYISDIYGTTFLIPEFSDINEADEEWLWENVNQYVWNHNDDYQEKNSKKYGYTYEDISKIVRNIYGDNLKKKFPKGAVSMRYDSYRDLYGPTSFSTKNYYNYKIDKIEQNGTTYTVSLYDYTISNSEEETFKVFNNYDYLLNSDEGTPIISVDSLKDKKFENLLKQKNLLSHKILTIEYNEAEKLYYITSCKYEDTKPTEYLSTMYSKMQSTFETSSIDYKYDDIYTQSEIIVNNFDELSSIYTDNSIETYKTEMTLFVYKDNGEVYITAGDITVGDYIAKIEFKDVQDDGNKISCNVVRTFRESFDPSDENYNKTYTKEDKFTIVKIDDKWVIDEFSYNNL